MSATMENHNEPPIPPTLHHDEDDAQSEVGDGSSSLSDIEQEADQDDQDDIDDMDSDEASEEDEENDSEAETERLHLSPSKDRAHKDVVMTESHTFERQPSSLHNHYGADEDDEDEEDDEEDNDEREHNLHDDDISDDELSLPDSPKSGAGDAVAEDIEDTESPMKTISAAPSAPKDIMHAFDLTNKKRKRSQIVDRASLGQNDTDEPSRKRTGSVLATGDGYAIDDDNGSEHDGMDTPNPVSGDLSDIESIDGQDDEDDLAATIDKSHSLVEAEEHMDSMMEDITLDRRARNSISKARPVLLDEVEAAAKEETGEGEALDDTAEVEADDDAEAALKDEAEQEKKRIALEQLGDIEKHFSSFRDRLHEERLAKLNHEEWMLKQDPPIHPEYLAMMQCIDERRDERLRLEERRIAYHTQTINKVAVARRAQILSQFYQDVRARREEKLELLGKQWYEIQHDRRAYGSNVEDYALKFQTKRQEQLKNQVAYNTEVSILSGIAKYRGFPAAPHMAPATSDERDEDFKLMGKTHQQQHVPQKQPQRAPPPLPLQDIAALRAASTGALNPAEEQFIEQTPWANPKHPSHAHLLHRQSSGHQVPRTSSPFSAMAAVPQPRKSSNPHAPGLPISGTFSGVNSASHSIHHGFSQGLGRRPLNEFNL